MTILRRLFLFVPLLIAACPLIDENFAEGAEQIYVVESVKNTGIGGVQWYVYKDEAGALPLDIDGDGVADVFGAQHTAGDAAAQWMMDRKEFGTLYYGPGVPTYRVTVKGRVVEIEQPPVDPPVIVDPPIPATASVIYVDTPDGPSAGDDANDGKTPETAVATITRVKALYRVIFDTGKREAWILFRRGDVWEEGFEQARCDNNWRWFRGDDADHPTVIGAYGQGDKPRFNLAWNQEFWRAAGGAWVRFVGLSITGKGKGLAVNGRVLNYEFIDTDFIGPNSTIEGSKVEGDPLPEDIRFTRCVFRDMILPVGSNGDLSAIYASRCLGLVIDSCVFDRVGWNIDADGNLIPDKRNHGAYLAGSNGPTVVINCIFTRCAGSGLQQRSGGECRNNFFADNGLNALNFGWMRTSAIDSYPPGPVPLNLDNVVILHRGGVAMRLGNCSGGVVENLTVVSDEQDAIQLDALSNNNVHGLNSLTVRNAYARSIRYAMVLAGEGWNAVTLTGNVLDGGTQDMKEWDGPVDGSIAPFADPNGGLTRDNNAHADLSGLTNPVVDDDFMAPIFAGETTVDDLLGAYKAH